MIKKILAGLGIVLLVLLIWQWSLVSYGVQQGWGQARIIWKARPVKEIMDDPAFPDSLKARLKLIAEIRRFAIDSLGLQDTENYQTVYDQQGKEIMWVVMACEPFALKAKMWEFPVVGAVPYKGYFNKDKASAEAKKLEDEGYDVSVRNPGGWSTLGWFTDPILSNMLTRSDGDLASLIIHEMLHATVWVKDSVDFNENLATFIGDTAAYEFLKYKSGQAAYDEYANDAVVYSHYSKHMLRGAEALDSLYKSMTPSEPVAQKEEDKQAMIQRIITTLDTIDTRLNRPRSKRFRNKLPNNTYFMSFRHYESKLYLLREEMNEKSPGDLRGYVHYLAKKFPK